MYGDNQKGYFDLPVGDTVKINMGFRVYEDDTQTRARINYDYEDEEFILLGSGAELAAEGAS